MDSAGRSILLGIVLGVGIVLAVLAVTVRYSVTEIKSAALELPAPLLFIPK